MRIRFNLRTLLIFTAVIAAGVGLALNQVMDVSRERTALEKFQSEWIVERDIYDSFRFTDPGFVEQYSVWANERLSGAKSRPRCREIDLFNKSNDTIKTMGQLPKLRYVTRLTLSPGKTNIFYPPTAPKIEPDDYRYVRKLRRLAELQINFPVSDAVVDELKQIKLRSLELKSENWTQSAFDAIGEMASLRSLHLKAEQFSRQNLIAIRKLDSLERLTLWTYDGFIMDQTKQNLDNKLMETSFDFSPICDLPKLNWLSVNGFVAKNQLEKLAQLKKLETLNLEYSNVDDSYFDSLMKLDQRPSLQFGRLQISAETYDARRRADFGISHEGLINHLTENYLRYGDIYYHLDPTLTAIEAKISAGDETVNWRIWMNGSGKHNPTRDHPPQFFSPLFQLSSDWRNVVGKAAEVNYGFGERPLGRLVLKEEILPEKNRLEFVSRTGNRMRIRCEFSANRSGQDSGEIDAFVTFDSVVVDTGLTFSADEARELLGQYFNVNDFQEPVLNWEGRSARFRLRESIQAQSENE